MTQIASAYSPFLPLTASFFIGAQCTQAQEAYKKACAAFEAKDANLQSLLGRRDAANLALLMPAGPVQEATSNGSILGARKQQASLQVIAPHIVPNSCLALCVSHASAWHSHAQMDVHTYNIFSASTI